MELYQNCCFLPLVCVISPVFILILYQASQWNGSYHKGDLPTYSNEDCYTNLHVQRFASAIFIDFLVITLCLTCFTLNSAVSSVVTDIF